MPPPSPHLSAFPAPEELQSIIQEVKYRSGLQSAKLIRQLRRRDRLHHKLQKNYDIVTACLQAVSQKRRKRSPSILLLLFGCLNFVAAVFVSNRESLLVFLRMQMLNCTQQTCRGLMLAQTARVTLFFAFLAAC